MTRRSFSATQWQRDIYINGFSGKRPVLKVALHDLEAVAQKAMSPEAFSYVSGGAGLEETINSNREGFSRYKIVPRMLRKIDDRDTSIELFGRKLPSPFLLSPVGVLELVHREADAAVGRAAAALGLPYIFSNQAGVPMEKVAAQMNDAPRWFQLYWSKSNELVASFVQRAEKCGCSAIAVTLDTTLLGWRTQDLDKAYLPFLEGKGIAQYTSDPVFRMLLDSTEPTQQVNRKVTLQSILGLVEMVRNYPGNGFLRKLRSGYPLKAVQKFVSIYSNPALQWDDLKFLRLHTKLPILLKGILHPDDARKAMDAGMDGIIVSNHGGRQVDGAIGTFEALPPIAEAVKGRIPILLDGGIRGGADAFKALALGARAVCVGRPYVYGLALAGQAGVEVVMRNLMADFELTMGLSGCKNISEITPDCLVRM